MWWAWRIVFIVKVRRSLMANSGGAMVWATGSLNSGVSGKIEAMWPSGPRERIMRSN